MPLDRTHQHISTSIMRDGDPQTPIDPDGGGGLTNPLTEELDLSDFGVQGRTSTNQIRNNPGSMRLTSQESLNDNEGGWVEVALDHSQRLLRLAVKAEGSDGPALHTVQLDEDGLFLDDSAIVAVLTDPGDIWQAETLYGAAARIKFEAADGDRVFRTLDGGTSGETIPDFEAEHPQEPATGDGSIDAWHFIGYVGQPPFAVLAETVTALAPVALVQDPGNVWEAETVVAEGYRIAVSDNVHEVTTAGTTDTVEPDPWNITGSSTNDGTATWLHIGSVGDLPVAYMLPFVKDEAEQRFAEDIVAALEGQTVPLTAPTVQDVIDALVAGFGLVQED